MSVHDRTVTLATRAINLLAWQRTAALQADETLA